MVDDEPLVALDIAQRLQSEGGSVKTAHGLADGLRLAGHPDLSAAVLDYRGGTRRTLAMWCGAWWGMMVDT